MTYSGASCSRTREAAVAVEARNLGARQRLDQQRVLRDGEDVRALGLAVPARDAREAVRDVLDLDVERGGIEQVEPAARQHALPCARRGFVLRSVLILLIVSGRALRTPRGGEQVTRWSLTMPTACMNA